MKRAQFTELVKQSIEKHGVSVVAQACQVRSCTIEAWAKGAGPHPVAISHFAKRIEQLDNPLVAM